MSDPKQWPTSIDQAVGVLIALLPEEEKATIADMSRKDLIGLHIGLGAWIRNNFGLWSGNRALLNAVGTSDADAASGAIIEALWQRLREEVPKIQ